jgi:hypothetical protein
MLKKRDDTQYQNGNSHQVNGRLVVQLTETQSKTNSTTVDSCLDLMPASNGISVQFLKQSVLLFDIEFKKLIALVSFGNLHPFTKAEVINR